EFEQNAFVARLTTTHLLSHCVSLLRRFEWVQSISSAMLRVTGTLGCNGCPDLQKRPHASSGQPLQSNDRSRLTACLQRPERPPLQRSPLRPSRCLRPLRSG